MNKLDNSLSREMIDKYGMNSQLDVVVEESSELIKEVIKYKRTVSHGEPYDIQKLKEELADTIVMKGTILELLREHGITENDVMQKVQEKQARTRTRYLTPKLMAGTLLERTKDAKLRPGEECIVMEVNPECIKIKYNDGMINVIESDYKIIGLKNIKI